MDDIEKNEFLREQLDLLKRKKTDEDLEWQDVADFRFEFNGDLEHRDTVRKGSKLLYEYIDAGWVNEPVETEDDSNNTELIKMRKEKIKLSDARVEYNRLIRQEARKESYADMVKRIICENVEPINIPVHYTLFNSSTDLLCHLTDVHCGIEIHNWKNDFDEDILKKYKRGYFIEWRIADKHKAERFNCFDYVVDTNKSNDPKMISSDTFIDSLKQLAQKPFRTVPYFDPGVWGGQWMKEVCNLDVNQPNYAWSFDGVPEENSILFDYDGVTVELPAMDLVLYQPKELLGEQVYSRFGAEFPIRFDFLDTMEGQNLSLQVHPLTEYIKKNFGMSYTQDESYYILDAKEDAHVYLGLKEGIQPNEMISDLESAQRGEIVFDADKYINKFPAKKHDHFLIPAGTCHCSGKNAMVLEISATPYIFTFKLWDWQRLGLDGLPRPINIEHGKHVIQWDRTTKWVKENLVNATYEVKEEGNDCKIEHTGLHELEFIETRRYTINNDSLHKTHGTVNMLNLIDGKSAIIEGNFEPFIVHYAETFIIPASINEYTIKPYDCDEVKVLKAYVRS